jgi:hypothetical protein
LWIGMKINAGPSRREVISLLQMDPFWAEGNIRSICILSMKT